MNDDKAADIGDALLSSLEFHGGYSTVVAPNGDRVFLFTAKCLEFLLEQAKSTPQQMALMVIKTPKKA